ncbi:Serine/threonine-protein kinase [Halomicronema hongdechloris C2206]|uniref:Serine/threonine-protein kinase n=1 Tax=Halomicronema hongdechloris C2206 TaxID=1641165 RepID=A0A1Z3HSQ9_9CYAN|nr:serine/threonine-protein kinase [Halomicronema hongdechloris]ASC73306.1 Serine/threonine-protein kinase [Halomicronema hongdechloris C2206]
MLSRTVGGRYHILGYLGGGGFGQTFLAEDRHLPGHPRCVVKQLKPRKTDDGALEAARRLFDGEAQALYQLGNHAQIPRLLAHFEENEQFYLVQEYVDGDLLSNELRHRCLPEAEVIEMVLDILKTLSFVHGHQVIHRDIKPSNLIRRRCDRTIVLIDFGSVKQVSSQPVETDGCISITIAIGSMGYMPNEQLAGQPCLSSDIYAVGMLALRALTGLDPKRFRKDPRTSEILWRDLVTVSPAFAVVLDQMVRYDHRQRYPSAQDALQALQALTQSAVSQPSQPPLIAVSDGYLAWLERGDELFQHNRYHEALAAYEKVIQAKPNHEQVWFKCGLAFESIQDFEQAIAAYDRVIQLQPHDYLPWLKRANVLGALQHYDRALAAYDEVLRLQPENYWAWNDRGQLLEKLQQVEEALTAYDRAIQLKADFQLALDNRKRLLLRLQRVETLYQLQYYDEVIAACDRALRQDSDDTGAWLMRGMALENLDRLPEAALSYHQVVMRQKDDHITWFKLGHVMEKLRRYHQATLAYNQVVRIQPDNHWAWYQRGFALQCLSQPRKALAAYNQAIHIKPDFQAALTARQALLNRLTHHQNTSAAKVAHSAEVATTHTNSQS